MNVILNLTWAVVGLPLIGIAAAFLAETPRRAAQVGMAVTALAFGAAIVLLIFRLTHQVAPYENWQTYWDLQVTSGAAGAQVQPAEFLLTWGIRVDPLSVAFMASVLFLSLVVQGHALVSARAEEGFRRFFWVTNLLTFGLLAMIAAPTLFQLWLGWEVVTVTTWFLATHVWQRAAVAAGAIRSFVILQVADLALLLALALTYSRFGLAVSQQTATNGLSTNDPFGLSALTPLWHAAHAGTILGVGTRTLVVLGVLFVVAAVVRAAVTPLHAWLTSAIDAPIAGLAMIALAAPLSAAVLVARVYPELVEAPHLLTVLALVGAVAAVAAAVLALAQGDLLRIGVFAVSSQAGLMLATAGMGGYSPALFIAFTSAALTVVFFLCAANIARRYRSRRLDDLGGAWRRMPRTSLGLLVWTLGISGLSLNSYSVLSAALRNTSPVGGRLSGVVVVVVVACVAAATALTSAYAVRAFLLVTAGEPARRRGFDSSRLREAEAPLVRSLGLAALAAVACTLVGIPGVTSFTIGSRSVPGLTFSHFIFYGAVRQVLAVDGFALLFAVLLGGGGAAAAWYLHAPRRRAAAAGILARTARISRALDGVTPPERALSRVRPAFVATGTTLDAIDRSVLDPIIDSVGGSTGVLSELLGRLRGSRAGISLAASMAVVALLVGASVLAITGHFPVVIR